MPTVQIWRQPLHNSTKKHAGCTRWQTAPQSRTSAGTKISFHRSGQVHVAALSSWHEAPGAPRKSAGAAAPDLPEKLGPRSLRRFEKLRASGAISTGMPSFPKASKCITFQHNSFKYGVYESSFIRRCPSLQRLPSVHLTRNCIPVA